MRSLARFLLLGALALGALFVGCNNQKSLGGLIVAIDSNVSVPQDIDGLGLAVSVNGITKFSNVYGVAPRGQVTLPATLTLEEPSDPGQAVNIRIMAFSGGTIKIVRDSITTVPHARIAVLHLQLSALSYDDGAKGAIDPNEVDRFTNPAMQSSRLHIQNTTLGFDPFMDISSKCDLTRDLADIDGVCQDAHVDSSTLPDAADPSQYTTQSMQSCFDVGQCFAGATRVQLDANCTFSFTGDATKLNVALVTTSSGFPTSTGYLAPLDLDPEHGFSVLNGVVTLPKAVCANNPHLTGVVMSTTCPSKTSQAPIISGGDGCATSGFDAGVPPVGIGATKDVIVSAAALGMTSVAAIAPYPGQSYLYVADISGSVRFLDVSKSPPVSPAATLHFSGDKGTAIATDGPNVMVITYPTKTSVLYAPASVTPSPTFEMSNPVTAGAPVYGAVCAQNQLFLATQLAGSLETYSPAAGNVTTRLGFTATGFIDSLATNGTNVYGTLYDATKPGSSTVTIMTSAGANVTTYGPTLKVGHTGAMVYVTDPNNNRSGLVQTNVTNDEIYLQDLSGAAPVPAVAAPADIKTADTDQPFNLATDGKGNVYYATNKSGIMKLPVYPTVGAPTPIVTAAAAKGARSVAYLNGALYFTKDNGNPSTSGVSRVLNP